MIVKILPPSQTFEGVNYSEKKTEKGIGELLEASNFEGMGVSSEEAKKSDYIRYMTAIGSLNRRVVNKQFHATISTKGNSHSFKELHDLGKKYLEEMGYSKNPYLIYSHSDTKNNHIHLVSTRVDKQGVKINDKYERIRSQQIIKKLMGEDIKEEVQKAINNGMNYNISSIAQFKMIIESHGYTVTEKDNLFNLIKYGTVQESLKVESIKNKIVDFKDDIHRKNQLTAILNKYKTGLTAESLALLLKDKFGLELVFHKGKGHDKPYGYSIIDHAKKNVFKGSDILNIKNLLDNPSNEEKLKAGKIYFDSNDVNFKTFTEIKKDLKKLDLTLTNKGVVHLNNQKESSFEINENILQAIKYNGRLQLANTYKTYGEDGREVLSKVLSINKNDISKDINSKPSLEKINHYQSILELMISDNQKEKILKDNNLRIIKNDSHLFLLDNTSKSIYPIESNYEKRLDKSDIEFINRNVYKERIEAASSANSLGGFIDALLYSTGGDDERPHRRKNKSI